MLLGTPTETVYVTRQAPQRLCMLLGALIQRLCMCLGTVYVTRHAHTETVYVTRRAHTGKIAIHGKWTRKPMAYQESNIFFIYV